MKLFEVRIDGINPLYVSALSFERALHLALEQQPVPHGGSVLLIEHKRFVEDRALLDVTADLRGAPEHG